MSKHGGGLEDVKKAIDLKSKLMAMKTKYYDLKVIPEEEQVAATRNDGNAINFYFTSITCVHVEQEIFNRSICI